MRFLPTSFWRESMCGSHQKTFRVGARGTGWAVSSPQTAPGGPCTSPAWPLLWVRGRSLQRGEGHNGVMHLSKRKNTRHLRTRQWWVGSKRVNRQCPGIRQWFLWPLSLCIRLRKACKIESISPSHHQCLHVELCVSTIIMIGNDGTDLRQGGSVFGTVCLSVWQQGYAKKYKGRFSGKLWGREVA